MLLERPIVWSLLFLALGPAWSASAAADPAAEAVLKGKGLAKSGRVYVIEAEAPALEKMNEVKAAHRAYLAAVERLEAADQFASQVAGLEQERRAMQASLNALNHAASQQQRMSHYGRRGSRYSSGAMNSPLVAERNQARVALAQIASTQAAAKSQIPSAKDRKALEDAAKVKQDALKKTLEELRPMVDEVTAKYADLNADPRVRKALEDLASASKTVVKTGPSEPFAAGARALAQAERQFLGKTPTTASASRKKARGKP